MNKLLWQGRAFRVVYDPTRETKSTAVLVEKHAGYDNLGVARWVQVESLELNGICNLAREWVEFGHKIVAAESLRDNNRSKDGG